MKSSIAIAALVLTSLAFIPGAAMARGGGGHEMGGPVHGGQGGTTHVQRAWRGGYGGYGYGYGRGWCYWHPYACYRTRSY